MDFADAEVLIAPRRLVRDKLVAYAASDPGLPDLTTDDAAEGVYKVRLMRGEEEQRKQSRLGQALETLDNVLMKDVNEITSDMNRTMYLIFNRMCFCYVRWRRHYMNRAQPIDENPTFTSVANLKNMAAILKKKASIASSKSKSGKP